MSKARQLRALYTVGELAEMAGISRRRLARKLAVEGVVLRPPKARRGEPQTVCLSQLRQAWPDLWDSLVTLDTLEAG